MFKVYLFLCQLFTVVCEKIENLCKMHGRDRYGGVPALIPDLRAPLAAWSGIRYVEKKKQRTPTRSADQTETENPMFP